MNIVEINNDDLRTLLEALDDWIDVHESNDDPDEEFNTRVKRTIAIRDSLKYPVISVSKNTQIKEYLDNISKPMIAQIQFPKK